MTPERLRRCLPGCERFEATDPTTFSATLRLGVAFLKGTYDGTVRVTEQDYPSRLGLAIEGRGLLGSLRAGGVLTFSARAGGSGATDISYEGDVTVGGRISALGEIVVNATCDRLIGRFWDCVASQIEP
jgi:carbon monoxide dehydrogenase subunit G